MSRFDRQWHGPIATVRPFLLSRALLVMLAFDLWVLRLPRAGRYGVDGFNVAHFGWLDAWQPLPTPELYGGLSAVTGLLALHLAFAGPSRSGLALLAVLHTYGWAMSQHDSYQHHYLLSWLLVALIFFPARDPAPTAGPRDTGTDAPLLASAWAYLLFGTTVALTYGFTVLAKLEPTWLSGHTLRGLGDLPLLLLPFLHVAAAIGLPDDAFWRSIAVLVVAMEGLLSLAYLLAPLLDRTDRRSVRLLAGVALGCAVVLHGSIELAGLHIGWFSYYMLLVAGVHFLPSQWLLAPVAAVSFLKEAAARRWGWKPSVGTAGDGGRTRGRAWARSSVWALVAAMVLVVIGFMVDLPGLSATSWIAALVVLSLPSATVVLGRVPDGRRPGATCLAIVVMAICLTQSLRVGDVRLAVQFDLYRKWGADLARLGYLEDALGMYQKAQRYAPSGESRREAIEILERRLER